MDTHTHTHICTHTPASVHTHICTHTHTSAHPLTHARSFHSDKCDIDDFGLARQRAPRVHHRADPGRSCGYILGYIRGYIFGYIFGYILGYIFEPIIFVLESSLCLNASTHAHRDTYTRTQRHIHTDTCTRTHTLWQLRCCNTLLRWCAQGLLLRRRKVTKVLFVGMSDHTVEG